MIIGNKVKIIIDGERYGDIGIIKAKVDYASEDLYMVQTDEYGAYFLEHEIELIEAN